MLFYTTNGALVDMRKMVRNNISKHTAYFLLVTYYWIF